jgi:hypothetical protein
MSDNLDDLEAEMLEEAAAALDEWITADHLLAELDRPTWGGVVDRWHEARDRVEAYRVFGLY